MSEMSDRIVAGLLQELETVKRSIANDPEREALAIDLHAAVHLIASHADAREDARRKKLQWEEIIPQCRATQEKFKKLNADAEKQNVVLANARLKADDAESRLNLKRDARPAPYPTPIEISEWEDACKKLEDELESARAGVRAANTRRGELTRELILARNTFTSLTFQERNLRPRQSDPVYSGSTLSAVR